MRSASTRGWRSARWDLPAAGSSTALPPLVSAGRARRARGDKPAAVDGAPGHAVAFTDWPWKGVEWSLSFVGLLVYFFAVTSYRIPVAQEAIILACIGLVADKHARVRFPAMMAFFAIYLLVAAVGYKGTEFSSVTWEPLLGHVKLFLITMATLAVLTTRARIRFFTFWYLACFAFFPVRGGLFNYFIYGATEQGRVAWNQIFSNPNDFSMLLLFPFALAMGLLGLEKKKWIRIACLGAITVLPLLIFLSQSRGTIIALAVGGLVVLLTAKRGRARAFLGIAAASIVLAIFAPNSVWVRLGALQGAVGSGNLKEAEDSGSAEQRAEIWKVAWGVGKSHPVLGVGLGGYPTAHQWQASKGGRYKGMARGFRDAHNTYLRVLAETGLLGLLAFLACIVAAWSYVRRARLASADQGRARSLFFAEVSLLATAICGLFGSYDDISFLYLQLALMWATATQIMSETAAANRQAAAGQVAR